MHMYCVGTVYGQLMHPDEVLVSGQSFLQWICFSQDINNSHQSTVRVQA